MTVEAMSMALAQERAPGAGPSEARPSEARPSEARPELHRLPRPAFGKALWRFLVVHAVFALYAAAWIADRLGLRWLAYAATGRRARYEPMPLPVALRLTFERLGPTYVKLGQLVASGEALFPPRYSHEFQKCLDRVPPFSFADVEATLERELGHARHTEIAWVDPKPMAAASIAQVHAARLSNGDEVVIKVQRPGLMSLVSADVAIMHALARTLSAISKRARHANLVGIVEDFEQNLFFELDFRNEARRMHDFNRVMRSMGTESVAAPRVYDAFSGERLLTMERFRGWSLADTQAVLASGYDAQERLITGIRAWFQTLICGGFFHGDVHAGNFMLLEDGRIGYLDFGIVGTFDEEQKRNVLEYVIAFQQRDWDKLAGSMIAMGTVAGSVDRDRFVADVAEMYSPMIDPEEGFRMSALVPTMLRVAATHQMRMPRDLVLVTKQLVYLDRYTRAIGGPKMNVLTDQRLTTLIMQDMFAAMFGSR